MRHRTLISNRARAMRKAMSEPEVMLWSRLRGRTPDGPTLRRQHAMGSIILDFYCPSARLAVEVDGATHWEDGAQARDEARDRWLHGQGIEVMRVPASWIYQRLGEAVDAILRRAEARRSLPPRAGPAPSTTPSAGRGPPPAASRGR
jgi:very-short-patch-repair endonuclease